MRPKAYTEFLNAFHAIGEFVEVAKGDPENVVLTKSLLLQILAYLEDETLNEESLVGAAPLLEEEHGVSPTMKLRLRAPATRILISLAVYLVDLIERLSPNIQRSCAQETSKWPCLVSLSDLRSHSPVASRIRTVKLGSRPGVGRPYPNESNCIINIIIDTLKKNQLAVQDLREAEAVKAQDPASFRRRFHVERFPSWALKCADLKPLETDGAWKEWFEVGWEALLDATGGHPEKNRRLRPLGLYRIRRTAARLGKTSSGTIEANIRDGIKTVIRRAFPAAALYPAKVV
jgi:hypothetical protein